MVDTDKRRLQQVLLNLLTNAVKFTPYLGKINIKVILIKGNYNNNNKLIIK